MNNTSAFDAHALQRVVPLAEVNPANDNARLPYHVAQFSPGADEVAQLCLHAKAAGLLVTPSVGNTQQAGLSSPMQSYEGLIEQIRNSACAGALETLDRLYEPDDTIELRMLSPTGGGALSFNARLGNSKEREQLGSLIHEHFGRRNLYIGINPRRDEMAGTTRSGSKTDVAVRRHVVLDLDDKDAPTGDHAWVNLRSALDTLQPKLVIRSGNGWHYWYNIEPAFGDNVVATEGVLARAMSAIGTDNMADAPPIIRLPFSINIPTSAKRKRGNTLALAIPDSHKAVTPRLWTVETLASALQDVALRLSPQVGSNAVVRTGTVPPTHLRSAPDKASLLELLRRLPNNDNYARDWQVDVAHAVRGAVKGTAFDDADVRDAFVDWSARYPGDPDHDANLYDGISSPKASWPHLVEMLRLSDPIAADAAANAAARAAFKDAAIDDVQQALIAAMPGTADPGLPEWAAKLNQRYAYVMGLDRVIETDPSTGAIVDRHTLQAFKTYQDGREQLQSGNGGRPVGLGSHWLKSPYARRYERVGMWPTGQVPPGVLNVWLGLPAATAWRHVPTQHRVPDPLTCILEFIDTVISSGRSDVANHVLNWMAWKLQHPLEAPGTTVALVGRQGTGKTTLAEMMIDMLGDRYAVTASAERQMVGNFNAHFEDKLIALFEEAFLGRDPRMAGPFKDLVTGARLHIEAKGRDVRDTPNRLAIMLTSNDASVVPLEPNDRRTTLIRVSNARRGDNAYFETLRAAWTNGGREVFMKYLLGRDLNAFDPRRPLNTPEKSEALAETGSPVVRYWAHVLSEGKPIAPWDLSNAQDWSGGAFIASADLYADFMDFCRRHGIKYLPSSQAFNAAVEELCPGRREARRRVHGAGQNGPRGHNYPPLDKCRSDFTTAANST